MRRASKFIISKNWLVLFKDMQLDLDDVLTHARLPADLFSRKEVSLTPAEYYQLWEGLEAVAGERNIALLLAEKFNVESFDPAIFACICSPNLNVALMRLKEYKPLIGPMLMDIDVSPDRTRLRLSCYGKDEDLPGTLGITELVFFTQLSRLATRSDIRPVSIQLPELPETLDPYIDYFGCALIQGKHVEICFRSEDASKPFLTSNAEMWEFFEGNLKRRLKDLNTSAGMVDRVRAVLLEALPRGESTIEHISEKLAVSKRTLQRKLTDEAETYQSVLQSVRTELADYYLEKSDISLSEISFMLGFQEPNSFIRAYTTWKGVSPGALRHELQ